MPEGYRVESCPNNRAVCKNKECKDAAVKITKGEMRFGTLFTIPQTDHTSFAYKHWGCVTPAQIANLQKFTDGDLDLVDGYDELPDDMQAKVRFAMENGHVADEDWKGDVEVNRPGKAGFRVKGKAKKASKEDDEEEEKPKKKRARATKADDDEDAPAPKKARGKKAAVKDEDAGDAEEAKPKKGRGKKAAVKKEESDEEPAPAPKKPRGKKAVVKEEETDEEPAPAPKKARGKKAAIKKEESDEEGNVSASEDSEPKPKKKAPAAKSKTSAPQKKGRKKAAPEN